MGEECAEKGQVVNCRMYLGCMEIHMRDERRMHTLRRRIVMVSSILTRRNMIISCCYSLLVGTFNILRLTYSLRSCSHSYSSSRSMHPSYINCYYSRSRLHRQDLETSAKAGALLVALQTTVLATDWSPSCMSMSPVLRLSLRLAMLVRL